MINATIHSTSARTWPFLRTWVKSRKSFRFFSWQTSFLPFRAFLPLPGKSSQALSTYYVLCPSFSWVFSQLSLSFKDNASHLLFHFDDFGHICVPPVLMDWPQSSFWVFQYILQINTKSCSSRAAFKILCLYLYDNEIIMNNNVSWCGFFF